MTPTPSPLVNVSSPPIVPPPPAKRCTIVSRYGEQYCSVCGFPLGYGACDREVATPAPDGGESDLVRRVRLARGKR